MSVYTPDLSGLVWDYYVSTYQRTIFKYPQKVMFEVPIFLNDRLEVTKLGTVTVDLKRGVDYNIQDDDIDVDAISVCKNIDPAFDQVLLKSITIISFRDTAFKIQVKFNQLFADAVNYARINQVQEIEVTPTLIANMVEQVAYLQQMVLDSNDTYSPQSSVTKLALNEYPNGDNDDNLIEFEPHDINTTSNKCLIRPIYGSFFKDSVAIKYSLSEEPLVPDVDFTIIDLDITRTTTTSNQSGVYRVIKILKDSVGEVKVSYRAYGGVADVASVRQVQGRINIIEQFLANTSYVTPSTLPADPTITSINNKLQQMEGTMRLLLQNGLPSYGDVSTGSAVLKKIVSQDNNLHWWSIATLYRVDGSVDDVLADVFKFRLKSLISNLMFECTVSVNAGGASEKRLIVDCTNSNVPADTFAKYMPKLRIIEVNAGGIYSGVILQLGMKFSTNLLQETFDIEDMSGRESCWKLVSFSETSTPPEDTGVLMPNGVSVFSYGETAAKVDETLIPFPTGINILNSQANIPLHLESIVSGILVANTNAEMVIQNLKQIDITLARVFRLGIQVNIGEADQRFIEIDVPIVLKDGVEKMLYGACDVTTKEANYQFKVSLSYDDTAEAFVISYTINTSHISTTLNMLSTKLLF